MNGNSLDLNTNARRNILLCLKIAEIALIVCEDCNEFAIELNCITHSCQQNASHSIRLNPIEIDFNWFTYPAVFDVTLHTDTLRISLSAICFCPDVMCW